jgi:dTDP-glucose 4,6-dehydratase
LTGNQGGIVKKPDLRLGDDPQRRQPDITRAKQILNWQPSIPLDEGIMRTIPYFRTKLGLA